MQKIIAFLLIIACFSCYRTVYIVTYSNVCGSEEDFIYTAKETNLSYQIFDPFVGYRGTDPPHRRAIVGINLRSNLEEEIYLFKESPRYSWGPLDVSNDRDKIAILLSDTLCVISREEDRIIEKIWGGKNPCFFPDSDSLLYEKDGRIFIYSLISNSERLFIEEGCNPRIDEEERKMVYKRDTQIVLLNLTTLEEFILLDTAGVSNPDISPDGSKIIYSTYDTSGTRTFFLIDTLGTALGTYEAKGAFIPNHWAINPYPYFVGNDRFVYRAYSENVPFKVLYLQELTNNTPILIREEFEIFDEE
jgi:dipeptidyl aminopeptidase/acylaminoacyl peptidase